MINIDALKDKYFPRMYGQEYSDTISRLLPYMNQIDHNRYTHGKIARTITIQVTENCNLRCTYCYQINKSLSKLKFETAKKFIELILLRISISII